MANKVKVLPDCCIGCGACVGIAPDVFEFDDEGKSKVVSEKTDSNAAEVDDAIASCPVQAIVEE